MRKNKDQSFPMREGCHSQLAGVGAPWRCSRVHGHWRGLLPLPSFGWSSQWSWGSVFCCAAHSTAYRRWRPTFRKVLSWCRGGNELKWKLGEVMIFSLLHSRHFIPYGPTMSVWHKVMTKGVHNIAFSVTPDMFQPTSLWEWLCPLPTLSDILTW